MHRPGTAAEIRSAIADGKRSAVEVCREALARIEAAEPALRAFTTVTAEAALARAEEIDRTRPSVPLAGVPIALKDNLCTRGIRTTAGSRILERYVPPYDATVVTRLIDAGAVIVGKTNCDEFAMGSSTENSAFGASRNPWDVTRIPGGSSGGSAATVAARAVPVALGSDTGGSIRQPAALCGIVGFRPSYGRVSRYGLLAFASSIDQVGPMTTSVADAALLMDVLAGPDPRDSTSAAADPEAFSSALDGRMRGVRIGVPRSLIASGTERGVTAAFETALETCRDNGATIVDVELPHSAHAVAVYYIVATAEASSNLARYDGVRFGHRAAGTSVTEMYERTRGDGFGLEVKRRIMLGTYVLSAGYYDAYYAKAQQVRALIRQDYDRAFERTDVIATPTSPTAAFKLGERTSDPLQMYLADVFTVSAGLAGLPAISVPCGFSGGLPVGLQLTGRAMDDRAVLRVGDAYERVTTWATEQPPLSNAR
ncbi:MAG TPA: Asp-tRNA(Asn)/Glu-tRNA(Gln) amidotransferase subunit GatA [Vicinamibacterales bacterium]